MKNKIQCELIQDLLPLYIDGLTHEETNNEIKEHLESCHICKAKYQNMSDDFDKVEADPAEIISEIDYLKKIKKNNNKKIIVGVVGTIIVIVLIGLLKLFVLGYPISTYTAKIEVAEEEIVNIEGRFYDSSSVYSHYKIVQENGEEKLIVYGCLPSLWNNEHDFEITYRLGKEDFNINGNTVTSNGKLITKKALDLYRNKNQYIGNMSANGKLSSTLGISLELGNYLNSLQTTAEPYGWTFEFAEEVPEQNQLIFNTRMESYAYVLLALIENCSEISWQYSSDDELHTKTVTKEQASQKLGNDIKQYSVSPKKVQELLDFTGIK